MSDRLPLFDRPRLRELQSMEAERAALIARIERRRPNSHKRVILKDRLEALTFANLRAEVDLEVRP